MFSTCVHIHLIISFSSSSKNLLRINICERNHKDVNEEHNFLIHKMKMDEERDRIAQLFAK